MFERDIMIDKKISDAVTKVKGDFMQDMFHTIVQIPPPFNMVVMIVFIGCIAGVLTGAATQIRKYGCHRQDVDFKRELVDRGLSADEIERIIRVQAPESIKD